MVPAPQPSPLAKSRKRPAVGGELSIGPNRELQPRTPGLPTVNEPIEPTAYPAGLADFGDQRKKKRGRPSKAEAEVKAAEYAARGEQYPPPRKPKNPKLPSEGVSSMGSSITFTPVTMGPSAVEITSSGKKRTPKTKALKDDGNPGYGVRVSAPQQTPAGYVNDPEPTLQAPQAEAVSTRVQFTAQAPISEGQDLGRRAQVITTEGFTTDERPSSANRHEATEGMLQTRAAEDQQTPAEQVPPEAIHGTTKV
ncbi:MAG: hypothetical protein Q9218_001211 [Villophora microphyllina]